VALRQQLATLKRSVKRPQLRARDRAFWILLAEVFIGTDSIGGGRESHLGTSEIGYSLGVRRVLSAGSRSALPLRFSVVFEYGGLIP
jgi:hypothetical protein